MRDTLGSDRYCIDTHLSCINISNIVIYQCIDIKFACICVQYFMTAATVVYYGYQLYIKTEAIELCCNCNSLITESV